MDKLQYIDKKTSKWPDQTTEWWALKRKQTKAKDTTTMPKSTQTIFEEDFTFQCKLYDADREYDLRIHMDVAHYIDDWFFYPRNKVQYL